MARIAKILLRTGTSAPSAGDFEVSEPAWDKTNGKLYIKNSAGTMVEIAGGGGGGISDGDKGDIVVSSSGTVWTLEAISQDIDNTATGYFALPSGTTAQRPGTPANGHQRYNSTLGAMETYVQGQWQVIANTTLDYGLITTAAATIFDYGSLS
jgi:hypothetical protein